jgi:hypothetical protein
MSWKLFRSFSGESSAVVALSRENRQTLAANANFKRVIIDFSFAFWSKRQRVLIAGLFGDARVELVEAVAFRAVIGVTARILRIADQTSEFAVEVAAAGGNGVDRNVIAEKSGKSFVVFVSIEFCAVLTVADKQNDLATIAGPILQEFSRGINRIVERHGGLPFDGLQARGFGRSAGSGNVINRWSIKWAAWRSRRRTRSDFCAAEFGEKFVLIFSETFARIKILIVAADKRFVVGAETADDGTKTRLDLVGIFGREVVVYKDDKRQRKSFNREKGDLLFDAVFKNSELIFFEIRHEIALAVFHGDGQNNESWIQNDSGWRIGGQRLGIDRRLWRWRCNRGRCRSCRRGRRSNRLRSRSGGQRFLSETVCGGY